MDASNPIEDNAGPGVRPVLILDDSEVDRTRLIRRLAETGLDHRATEAASLSEFSDALDERAYQLVFIDFHLGQEDGLAALDRLLVHPRQRQAAAIMVAGEGQIHIAVEAMRRGCADYLTKDALGVDVLRKSIATALERKVMHATLEHERALRDDLARSIETIVATSSSEMKRALSGLLRKLRQMRMHHRGDAFFRAQLAGAEANCDDLWKAAATLTQSMQAASRNPRAVGVDRPVRKLGGSS